MNRTEFQQIAQGLVKMADDVMWPKMHDYTGVTGQPGSGDCFANFKRISARINIPAEKVWAVYLLKHIDAILTYIDQGGESEPISGRFIDVINYARLGYGLIYERSKERAK